MKRYSVRPAKFTDLEGVRAVIAQQNTVDYGSPMVTTDDLQKKWQSINLEDDTCTAFANNELAGYAELLEGDSPFIYLADRNNIDLAFQFLVILENKVQYQNKGTVNLFTRISEKNNTLLQLF